MCWCAESQMKWVWGEYCVLNNLKRGEFAEDVDQNNIPHCDSVSQAGMTVLPLQWPTCKSWLYCICLFIYFLGFFWTEHIRLRFRKALLHTHEVTHIRTSESQGLPTAVYRAFLYDQPGVNCLARGRFHKSFWGMCWRFSFPLPSPSQILRNSLAVLKKKSLWLVQT